MKLKDWPVGSRAWIDQQRQKLREKHMEKLDGLLVTLLVIGYVLYCLYMLWAHPELYPNGHR
jgi:hypothetical protein